MIDIVKYSEIVLTFKYLIATNETVKTRLEWCTNHGE